MIDIKIFLADKLLHQTTISKNRISIGRSDTNDVVLANKLISRLHFEILEENGQYFLKDHSRNGTFLDDSRIDDRVPLPEDSRIQIHPFVLHCTTHSEEVTLPFIEQAVNQGIPEVLPRLSEKFSGNKSHFGYLIGEDPKMLKIYQTIQRVAASPASVLIRGDSGTGKELVAKSIHQLSTRSSSPFIPLDCASIPDNLIESELFGYEKGAFTGATSQKKGLVEAANGGTLFLDEVGELSPPAQAKLLRFLQDRSFYRLGSTRQLKADVRLVTATNRDLESAITSGEFRSDLYYRLRVVQIVLPTLKERIGDIPLLVNHILDRIQKENKLDNRPNLADSSLETLKRYSWPGNIRQLENVLYQAFISSTSPAVLDIKNQDLPATLETSPASFQDSDKSLLIKTLEDCRWNTSAAAEALKVSRGTIYYKCKKLGIDLKELSR